MLKAVEKCGQWICWKRWIYNGGQRSAAEYGKHYCGPSVVKCRVYQSATKKFSTSHRVILVFVHIWVTTICFSKTHLSRSLPPLCNVLLWKKENVGASEISCIAAQKLPEREKKFRIWKVIL